MGFQKTVNVKQTPGIPGDFYDNSPRRVQPGVISDTGTGVVGKPAFFVDKANNPNLVSCTPDDNATAANFAGIVVNGKELVRAGGLTSGLDVASGSVVSLCTMGRVWLKVASAVTVGATVNFNTVSNAFTTDSGIAIGKAVIVNSAADGMAVIELG